jgi:6-phospho-beta-glucosidase
LTAVKSYEILTSQAAAFGDRAAAYQALIAHPLGPKLENAQQVLDDMLETNRKYLPQFFK